ncbi:MAG: DUF3575 domain-containing protein [Bacteroidales bacterium]|nr:DUF3575 domain-containing protein [Bacteroidales bacterium]
MRENRTLNAIFASAAAELKSVVVLCVLVLFCSFSLRAQACDSIFLRAQACDTLATRERNTAFAVKTNVLYHAATMFNAEIEIPIGKRISLVVEDVFPWWETGYKYCLQMLEIGAEGRFWFNEWERRGTDKLVGPFVGVYAMSAKYDFQYKMDVDYQGEYWSAGITGGWNFNLGREPWGRLELSLGLGYLRTDYRSYLPTDAYDKLIRNPYKTGVAQYFGPTKAVVGIVIPVNFKTGKKEVNHD